ncbi:hypothetical protein DF034_31325 [Burkholderia anthina]|nr:hypothetical protein DF034_31325 [Burkholderia anthina]
MSRPAFRYHPDPLATGGMIRSGRRAACVACVAPGPAAGGTTMDGASPCERRRPFAMKQRNLREVHPRGRHSP